MNANGDAFVPSGVRTRDRDIRWRRRWRDRCDLVATGAMLVVKALYELRRTGGRYGLVTMCIGGGRASPPCSSGPNTPGGNL
jgi:hypothetical protein